MTFSYLNHDSSNCDWKSSSSGEEMFDEMNQNVHIFSNVLSLFLALKKFQMTMKMKGLSNPLIQHGVLRHCCHNVGHINIIQKLH